MEIEDKLDLSASQTIIPLVTRAGNQIQLSILPAGTSQVKIRMRPKAPLTRSYLRYRVVRKR